MTALETTLAFSREAPGLVETAIRSALAEAIRWRCGGGAGPASDAIVTAALAHAKGAPGWKRLDAPCRMRLMRCLERATRTFLESPLGARLLVLPRERFIRVPDAFAADILVTDERGGAHLVSITRVRDALDLAERARRLAASADVPREALLSPLTIHLYSLATKRRYAYSREQRAVVSRRSARRIA